MGRLGLVASALVLVASGAWAGRAIAEPAEEPAPSPGAAASPLRRFQVEHLERLLSGAPAARRRAIQRLAALGTEAALERLTRHVLGHGSELGGKDWLSVARALAPHASRASAELVLATLMSHRPGTEASPEELGRLELARGSAALALAAAGTHSGLAVLGRALRAGGTSAELAATALSAHPPARLEPVLETPGEPTAELARLLGALGDQRAFHILRQWVRGGTAEVRAAAALALTELGAFETVPLAEQWLQHSSSVLREAALDILMLAQHSAATRSFVDALRAGSLSSEQRARLPAFAGPELVRAVARHPELVRGDAAPDALWWALMSRGDSEAAARLGAALGERESAFAAAHALSRMHDAAARAVLERALASRVAAPLAARALAARAWIFGEPLPPSFHARLDTLSRSESATDRAAAAWARSLAGGEEALAELRSADDARSLAAATNALALSDSVTVELVARLAEAPHGRLRAGLAAALSSPSGRRAATSALLRSLVADAPLARPLALRALASRPLRQVGPLVQRYASDPDPLLRAHVARGLGESEERSVVGLLDRMYEFETDEDVRHAIVCALSSHRGPAAQRTLALAARLDPSRAVRSAARLALGGVRLGDPPPRAEAFWTELRPAAPAGAEGAAGALVTVAPGLALPVFGDADGVLVVGGVGVVPLGLRLL